MPLRSKRFVSNASQPVSASSHTDIIWSIAQGDPQRWRNPELTPEERGFFLAESLD